MRNWAGNVRFSARERCAPTTLDELRSTIIGASRIRAVGSAHSFNHLADTDGLQVSVESLPRAVQIDTQARRAWVPGGARYGDIARTLHAQGWAVHNLASLPHITVAGTIATGTHGSGDRNGTLASIVTGLELVTATGDIIVISDDDPRLAGAVVSLGALGIVTAVQLAIEPAFDVVQDVIDDVARDRVRTDFDAIFSSAYSVSCFTDWGPDRRAQLWVKRRLDGDLPGLDPAWIGGQAAAMKRHPVPGHDPVHCTEQGIAGPWHERLPHFKLEFTPSSGEELQTEYLVPRSRAPHLLDALEEVAPRLHPLVQVTELRTMRSDRQWLSPAYGRDTVGIHFTWLKDDAVLDLLPELDDLLGAHDGRPHWGKLFDAPADDVAARYGRFADFAALVTEFDPTGKFRNPMVDALLHGTGRIGR